MKLISLLTDFGDKDNFVGVMKAVILKINPQAKIVDLCHQIKHQGLEEAAFLLAHSFKYFPEGTIHLVVVDPGVGTKRKKILVKTKNYYFVAPDNGVLSAALKLERAQKIIEITKEKYFLKPVSNTFHGRDIFAPAAAHLSLEKKPESFGKKISKIKELNLPKPNKSKNELNGQIIYIDHFGNLITNIKKASFNRLTEKSFFKICCGSAVITKISHSYVGGKATGPKALFNSFENLEIAVPNNSAQKTLSLGKGDIIRVKAQPTALNSAPTTKE